MGKKQTADVTDKYSWAVEGARVLIKSYPLLAGEYGTITSRPSGDAAVVEFGVNQREYIPLRHLEQLVLEKEVEVEQTTVALRAESLGENLELSSDEERDRHRLELKVEKALSSAWLALKELRDRRLYRQTHHTFEEYAKDRFGYNRAHAYRLIAAGEVIENLSPEMSPTGRQNESGPEMSPTWRQKLPTTESVCRELAKLPAEKQPIAWEKVLAESGDKIPNARCAKGIVEQLLEKPRTLASDYASEGEIFVLQRLEGAYRRYNGYWAVALEVEERFTVKCQVYNQTLDIRQENIKRVDMTSEQLEQQKKVIERVSRLARCNLDPVVWSMLETLNRQVYYTDVQLKFLEMAEKLYGLPSS